MELPWSKRRAAEKQQAEMEAARAAAVEARRKAYEARPEGDFLMEGLSMTGDHGCLGVLTSVVWKLRDAAEIVRQQARLAPSAEAWAVEAAFVGFERELLDEVDRAKLAGGGSRPGGG